MLSIVDRDVQGIRIRSRRNPYWLEGPIPLVTLGALRSAISETRPQLIHTHENAVLSLQILRLRSTLNLPMVASCYFYPYFLTALLKAW